ncbi:MAG: ATP-dependent sacrificial sulfur transferase LarE [Clostridia bacterium]
MEQLQKKMKELLTEGLCVAFSGGVDSSVILKLACIEAKKQNKEVFAVTFETKLHPCADIEIAKKVAKDVGATHHIIKVNELDNVEILNNPVDRCYICKKYLFQNLKTFAQENGIKNVIDGTNFDDLKEYRPGIKALNELGVISPLVELEINKKQVREFAEKLGLSVSKRPSAPCLATRLPYNTKIEFELLEKIDIGENFLKSIGFLVNRIRVHGDIARIEIEKCKFSDFIEQNNKITQELQEIGFTYITLDMQGFRSGSMDIYVRGE